MSATGTGKDGRITKGDVLDFLNRPPRPRPPRRPPRRRARMSRGNSG